MGVNRTCPTVKFQAKIPMNFSKKGEIVTVGYFPNSSDRKLEKRNPAVIATLHPQYGTEMDAAKCAILTVTIY